jgi:hypothetical protein
MKIKSLPKKSISISIILFFTFFSLLSDVNSSVENSDEYSYFDVPCFENSPSQDLSTNCENQFVINPMIFGLVLSALSYLSESSPSLGVFSLPNYSLIHLRC